MGISFRTLPLAKGFWCDWLACPMTEGRQAGQRRSAERESHSWGGCEDTSGENR
ncbi:hypothetical protein BAZMOX_201620_0 [methanotrophic endosymbiont of Bathymodiolus azoricus (Menez Gwen)]|nr:hypothetical protein BAZMOX_201620_0 [methanotrophic endosymbiont of Bathymodiolus azoricus (Menez Gwen)]